MSDLISRQDAIDVVHYYIESGYKCDIFQELKNLPSAEPKQTAKVKEGWGLAICCACEKRVFPCDDYCSHCGARLEWNE